MNVEQLTELLANAGVEIGDNVKIDDIHKGVNDVFTGIIKTKTEQAAAKALKNVDKNEFVNNFIKEQGYENVDQFNAFIKSTKSSADEKDEALSRISKEKEELENKFNESSNSLMNLKINNIFGFSKISKEKAEDFLPIVKAKLTGKEDDEEIQEIVKEIIEKYNLNENEEEESKRFKFGASGNPKKTDGKKLTLADKINANLNKK